MATRMAPSRSAPPFLGSSSCSSSGRLSASVFSKAPSAGESVELDVTGSGWPARMRGPCDATRASRRCSPLLRDLGLLATQLAQVVELGAAHVTTGGDVDVVDVGRVHREGALDADAVAFLAHGEGLTDPAALAADDDTL